MRGVLVGAGAVGVTLVLVISGCGSAGTAAVRDGETQVHEGTSRTAAGAHNEADVAFAEDMIPHHEQAIVMSDIVLAKRGIDPRVLELAHQIKAAQVPEIQTMRGWLRAWGSPATFPDHEGHDMPGDMPMDMSAREAMGMMTDQQLDQLRQATGAEAGRLFLVGMIEHHEGAVRMATAEVDTGESEAAVHSAREIIESQQREIDVMKQILTSR
jgi:uncharacterized protein (DUF305 family)